MNINKVMVYGNLTRDPEVRQLPSGTNVANLGIATNRYYNNQEGQRVEEVEYHNVVLFGRLADLAQQYLNRGGGVYIEGRLRTSSWDDKETGQKRYRTENHRRANAVRSETGRCRHIKPRRRANHRTAGISTRCATRATDGATTAAGAAKNP